MSAIVNKKRWGNTQEDAYRAMRVRFIQKGTTMRRWALSRGFPPTTAYGAARGERSGVEAVKIRNEMEAYLNG